MAFLGFDHVSMIVADTERALGFYRDILELKVADNRPDLPFSGAWLMVSEQQQIHLLEVTNPDPVCRPAHGGRDRHLALRVNNIKNIQMRLEQYNIAYTVSQSGRKALFCRDFDGNTLEFLE